MAWALSLLVVVLVAAAAVWLGRRYFALRGARIVECPETKAAAAVSLRAARAAAGGSLSLAECSRWPERKTCGRQCLAQIEQAPADCLVRTIVTGWYAGKTCTVCRRPLGEIDWFERKPGFVDASGKARPWTDVPPEQLPDVLARDQPICFDCYVAATFRQQHPELVTDNRWERAGPEGPAYTRAAVSEANPRPSLSVYLCGKGDKRCSAAFTTRRTGEWACCSWPRSSAPYSSEIDFRLTTDGRLRRDVGRSRAGRHARPLDPYLELVLLAVPRLDGEAEQVLAVQLERHARER